jgi:hypothetical protein
MNLRNLGGRLYKRGTYGDRNPWDGAAAFGVRMPASIGFCCEALGSLLLYTLTGICAVEYNKRVESVFEVIAEPSIGPVSRTRRE